MEKFSEAESTETTGAASYTGSVIDAIKEIAAYNARADLDDEHQLLLFLQSWWSKIYNRPLKDPILMSYTIEELIYEFYDRIEREKASEERIETESDRIEEAKEKAVLDWIDEEEKKENEELEPNDEVPSDPTSDPENIKWMQEHMRRAKEQYGDSFGEDIVENFE